MQADDLAAFEAFFARHSAIVFRTAYGLTGDREVAEEVLQDTFERAYRHRGTLRTDVSPVPWLYRVTLNLCYSRLGRRRLPTEPIGEALEHLILPVIGQPVGPAERAERQELSQLVRDGVASLPLKQRSVVVLYYLHGLSLQETAELLDLRVGTVKSRLHYGLRTLREVLERDRRFDDAYGLVPDELEAPSA